MKTMFKKIKKLNKKGYAGALVDFFSWIAYFIILIIFIALFTAAAKTAAKTLAGINTNSESSILYSYLRTSIDFNGKEISIADLIVLYYIEEDNVKKKEYYDLLLDSAQRTFNSLEFCHRAVSKQIRGYALYIFDKDYSEAEIRQNYGGNLLNQNKKFRSKHFEDNVAKVMNLPNQALPLPEGKTIYVNFMFSDQISTNTESGARGC
ncbi:hypothetical protein HYU07_00135 [Candidatus Woesearchaeota archaeon]|nr:hypothetical protein [Candidatus Woesearchaeota archaeon]